MQLKRFLATGAVALAALAALPALAQNCAGFGDVLATNPFCPNVEWVKNRGVTLGCGDGTNYCPDDPVSRLAMAAFMNRLGNALTPKFVRKRDLTLGALNFTGQQTVCVTDAEVITGYPRSAIVRGLVNLYTPDGGMDIKAWVVYSADGGPWLAPATGDGLAYGVLYGGFTPPNDISLNPMNVIDLNVGTSYRFALAAIRTAGTGQVANTYCENLVELISRTGASTPFDAAADGRPHGRGD